MKPVGGRKNSGAVRVVVGKPGFHRHEAGWGTLDSVQPTIRSGIQIFNSSHSIKTIFRIPPLSTDWTDRTRCLVLCILARAARIFRRQKRARFRSFGNRTVATDLSNLETDSACSVSQVAYASSFDRYSGFAIIIELKLTFRAAIRMARPTDVSS